MSGQQSKSAIVPTGARPKASELATPLAGTERLAQSITVPKLVVDAGDKATRSYANFFGTIENDNTRAAYTRACLSFFTWCDSNGFQDLADIEPIHVGAYVKASGSIYEKPTVKQHLAAIRMLFDWLVVNQVIALNPAHSVRGPKHVVARGKTPVLTAQQTRELLDSIDVSNVIGLRDRALIALMTYSLARVSAAASMRVEDYFASGKRWLIRLHEKGGKLHEMPVHHNLETYLDAYIEAAGIESARGTPLFRSMRGRTGLLTQHPMHRIDVWRMIVRRAAAAGIDEETCCHTFRATGITTYMENGGTLEKAQSLAAHASPRTTKLYDRTKDKVTLDEVERIII